MPKKKKIKSVKSLDKAIDKAIDTTKPKLEANYKALGTTAKKQAKTYLSGYRKEFKQDVKTRRKLKENLDKYFKKIEKESLKSVKSDLKDIAPKGKSVLDITNIRATQSTKGNVAWSKKLGDKQVKDYTKYINDSVKQAQKLNPQITEREVKALIDQKTESFINTRLNTTLNNEASRIQNQVRIEAFKKSGVVQGVIFTAVLDNRTTINCQTKDGTKLALNDPRLKYYMIPQHVNCRSYLLPVTIDEKFKPTSKAKLNIDLLKLGKPKTPKGQPKYYSMSEVKNKFRLYRFEGMLFFELYEDL